MNTTTSLIIVLFLAIGALASTLCVLYAKLKASIGNLFIKDEDGNVKSFKTVEFIRIVIQAVTEAEKTGKKGEEKKDIALNTIQSTLNALGVEYDIRELSSTIDTLVSLINTFTKKKTNKK